MKRLEGYALWAILLALLATTFAPTFAARDGSGNYVVPNTFAPNETISSADHNQNFTDLGNEITNSLPRDGQVGMTGIFKATSGTVAAPGMSFTADPDTGFYRIGADQLGVAVGGVNVATFSSTGLAVTGAAFTGQVSCGARSSEPSGWLFASGLTIGNALSGGTARANADTETLFTELWNSFANTELPIEDSSGVASTRGTSASVDFASNKRMPLPDLRDRTLVGKGDMGGTDANHIPAAWSETLGGTGGDNKVTLTQDNLPDVTLSSAGLSGSVANGSIKFDATWNNTRTDGTNVNIKQGTGSSFNDVLRNTSSIANPDNTADLDNTNVNISGNVPLGGSDTGVDIVQHSSVLNCFIKL